MMTTLAEEGREETLAFFYMYLCIRQSSLSLLDLEVNVEV